MTSAATIASIVTTCQNGIMDESQYVSSDELMLEELERRDGMYSFIFHELDSSKLTKCAEPENHHNHSPIQIHELDSPKLTKIIESEANHNHSPARNSLSSETYFKKLELSHTEVARPKGLESVKIATSTKCIANLTNDGCELNDDSCSKSILNSIAAATTTTTTTMTTTTTTGAAIETTKENTTKLPTQSELLRYQQYLRTWYPPTPTPPPPPTTVRARPLSFMKGSAAMGRSSSFYLNKRPSNLYVCMMNCGVSVRQQPPRFSHITEPLVRNRRHALKESDEYKQRTNNLSSLRAPDLRALFPYDPDVHAPFLTSKPDTNASSCLMEHLDVKSNAKTLLVANGEIK